MRFGLRDKARDSRPAAQFYFAGCAPFFPSALKRARMARDDGAAAAIAA